MKSSRRVAPAIQLLSKDVLRLETNGGRISVAYKTVRSKRARFLRLTINREREVVLTLPGNTSLERGVDFMRTKSEWLQRHLARIGPRESLYQFLQKQALSIDGGSVAVVWQKGETAWLKHHRESEQVEICLDPDRHDEEALKDLLRQLAAQVLPGRTRELAARQSLLVNKITVRDQVSRWGSCSAHRNISLNWRLILLPPRIQDYVIWHELSHLTEMNHSSRFWELLDRYDPGSRRHDEILSELASRVMAIGRVRSDE